MAQLSDDCFAFGGRLITLPEALALVGERFACVAEPETVALAAADGRVLVEDIVASQNVPRHDNSAVDGYAVHFDDLSSDAETVLAVSGRAAAGHPMLERLGRGRAARVFTGALMPDGPDTVIMQEDCAAEGDHVRIRPGIKRGANRRLAGEDVRQGLVVLSAGRRLGPPETGLAASVGLPGLRVRRRLRVALFSTGDEVAEPGAALAHGQIYDSNRFMVAALLRRAGAAVTDGGILPDRPERIRAALDAARGAHDLILTSGGVSMGEEDHVRAAIKDLGTLAFWRLGIKPGRPVAVGEIRGTPLIALPGNPVAAMVTYMAIARPLIAVLGGETRPPPMRLSAVADFAYRKKPDRREYVRVRLATGVSGLVASRFGREGVGILSSLTESDALAELPEEMTELEPGNIIPCLPLAALFD
jgi:molybdopterin molybdotransferase